MNPNEEYEVTQGDRDALCADMALEEAERKLEEAELRDLEAMRTRMRPVLTVMLLCAAAGLAGIACMIWFTNSLRELYP